MQAVFFYVWKHPSGGDYALGWRADVNACSSRADGSVPRDDSVSADEQLDADAAYIRRRSALDNLIIIGCSPLKS